eukprot:Nk52_evm64s1401 gene=Nk52_evmTU64s1401
MSPVLSKGIAVFTSLRTSILTQSTRKTAAVVLFGTPSGVIKRPGIVDRALWSECGVQRALHGVGNLCGERDTAFATGASSEKKNPKTAGSSMAKKKFYAVARGKTPGIYSTWDECKAQVTGFSKAMYKGFVTRDEAEAYMRLNSPLPDMSAEGIRKWLNGKNLRGEDEEEESIERSAKRVKVDSGGVREERGRDGEASGKCYYAVRAGERTGIFRTWAECQKAAGEREGVQLQSFDSLSEAQAYIHEGRSDHLSTEKGDSSKVKGDVEEAVSKPKKGPSVVKSKFSFVMGTKKEVEKGLHGLDVDKDGFYVCYTDGASRGNGKTGARAGVGVFFQDGFEHNISEPLGGDVQTNNRAELTAGILAIHKAKRLKLPKLLIKSDSQYMIKGVTEWIPMWKKDVKQTEEGTTLFNKEVKNKDLFSHLDQLTMKGDIEVRFEHVAAHSGIHGNEMADSLAVSGASK